MNRIELRIIARIILIGVGFYVLLQTLTIFLGSIAMMPFVQSDKSQFPMLLIAITIHLVISLAIIYLLFRFEKFFSAKIINIDSTDETQVSWLPAAFRLVCVGAGVLFLFWSGRDLMATIFTFIVNMKSTSMGSGQQKIYIGNSSIIAFAKDLVLLGISIYLAYGAPGFVEWQVKRTLKQCRKIEERQQA